MNRAVLLHGRLQRIPSILNQTLPGGLCTQTQPHELLTRSHLSPHPQMAPHTPARRQGWYWWAPTSSTVCQQRTTAPSCKAWSFPTQLFHNQLITIGLFQKGHLEQLGTFGAPNHVTWVRKRGPWHRAHRGNPKAVHSLMESTQVPLPTWRKVSFQTNINTGY